MSRPWVHQFAQVDAAGSVTALMQNNPARASLLNAARPKLPSSRIEPRPRALYDKVSPQLPSFGPLRMRSHATCLEEGYVGVAQVKYCVKISVAIFVY